MTFVYNSSVEDLKTKVYVPFIKSFICNDFASDTGIVGINCPFDATISINSIRASLHIMVAFPVDALHTTCTLSSANFTGISLFALTMVTEVKAKAKTKVKISVLMACSFGYYSSKVGLNPRNCNN